MDKIKIKDVNLLLLIVLPLTFLIVSPFSHIIMMIIILAWIGRNELHFRDFLYLRKVSVSMVLLSALIGALLALMNFFDHFYFQFTIESLGKSALSLSVISFIFIASVLTPPIEELFFRGVLYNFYKKKGILPAIIISSVLFSILHFNLYGVIVVFIIGVFLALLYEITQCFWLPVLAHGSFNAIHSLLVVEPVARYMKVLLYWLQRGNALLFRLKLLLISIVLFILVILVMFLIMRISGNDIFRGQGFKNMKLIKRDDSEPLIDKYLILVFVIIVSIVVKIALFKPV